MLIFVILTVFVSCTANIETRNEQYQRLLNRADELQKEKLEREEKIKKEEADKILEIKKEQEKYVDPHLGKTRGEIMQYEMGKVKEEMGLLKEEVDNYVKKEKTLKEYKERLNRLEKLNKVSM